MKIITALIIALFLAVPAMADDTFEIVTGDNEVGSIEAVEVAITYSPLTKTIAELYAEYSALQAEKDIETQNLANINYDITKAQAEKAAIIARGTAIIARMAALVSLRDAILAAAADVVLTGE